MLILIGAIIGFIMGMTGAGGALIAIPLFMHFLGMSLKDASTFSLVAVVIATFSNFYFQRKDSNIRLALIFIFSSMFGSFVSQQFKSMIPEYVIIMILTAVTLYSLFSVWVPQKKINIVDTKPHLGLTLLIGSLLGVLTTFTGLGGGVLMLPILISIYRLPQKQAVATSLLIVGASSLSSFFIQVIHKTSIDIDMKLMELAFGIFIMSFLLKILLAQLKPVTVDNLRKVIFTFVVIFALAKIISA